MRIVADANEAGMVATFLNAEVNSERWGKAIIALLQQGNLDRRIVAKPNRADAQENRQRAQILGEFRGYGQNRSLFEGYPDDGSVVWQWVMLNENDLARVRYIDYSYWNILSGETRLARMAVENIRRGTTSYGVPDDGFWKLAQALQNGAHFPPLILVSGLPPTEAAAPVVLEGHVRLTVYLLIPEHIPAEVLTLWGSAPAFADW